MTRFGLLLGIMMLPGGSFTYAEDGSVSEKHSAPAKVEVTKKKAGKIAEIFLKQHESKDHFEPTPFQITDRGDRFLVSFRRLVPSDSGNGMVQVDKATGKAKWLPGK